MSGLWRPVRRRAVTGLLVAILVAGVLPSLGGCVDTSPEAAGTHALSIGVSREELSALAYIARNEGIFLESGLDVEFVEYSSSQLALEALLSGDVDCLSDFPRTTRS
jgi:ABC-type nitrate/sulfonate/bicarbonate transport system substrate-binding protein